MGAEQGSRSVVMMNALSSRKQSSVSAGKVWLCSVLPSFWYNGSTLLFWVLLIARKEGRKDQISFHCYRSMLISHVEGLSGHQHD